MTSLVHPASWWKSKELTQSGRVSYVLVSNVADGLVHFFAHDPGHPEGKQACTRLLSKWHEKYEVVPFAEVPENWGRRVSPYVPRADRFRSLYSPDFLWMENPCADFVIVRPTDYVGYGMYRHKTETLPKRKSGFAKFINKVEGK